MEDNAINSVAESDFAGLGRRVAAFLVDAVLIAVVLNVLVLRPNTFSGLISIQALATVVFLIVYEALFVYFRGATLGKFLLNLQVVDYETRNRPSILQCFIRPLAKMAFGAYIIGSTLINFVVLLFNLVNIFVMASDSEHRGIHDKVARAAVLRTTR